MSAKDFALEDQRIREENRQAVAALAEAGGGGGESQAQETVYRDKRGRKLDMLNEFMRQEAIKAGKAVAEKQEEYEWGLGTKQKEEAALRKEELENIANEPIAPRKDDPRLDAMYREKIHADDPMAEYMLKKKQAKKAKAAAASGKPLKPSYKGPPPPPNRFGISPGYRWDGRDRGNGWEARVLGLAAGKQRVKDAAYQWSVSDM